MKMTKEQRQMYNLFLGAINWDAVKKNEKQISEILNKDKEQKPKEQKK